MPKSEKKPYYWVREDFDHLMSLLPAADHEFPDARKSSSSLQYPKNIEGAFRELRLRGLECDASVLMRLVEQRIVVPAGELSNQEWSKEDIDAAAEWLNDNQHWTSWTHYCSMTNLKYGQCVKAFRVAAAMFGLPFTLSFDTYGLVTVVEPPENPDGYAYIRFFPKGTKVEPEGESK